MRLDTRLVTGIARWFPFPGVLGLLVGIVLPFVAGVFDQLAQAPLLVGATIVAYLLSIRLLPSAIPSVLIVAVAGVPGAVVTGQVGDSQTGAAFAMPFLPVPEFSLRGLVTVTPVAAALMMLQANIPSIVCLRIEGYRPPERAMWAASGFGAFLGWSRHNQELEISLAVVPDLVRHTQVDGAASMLPEGDDIPTDAHRGAS